MEESNKKDKNEKDKDKKCRLYNSIRNGYKRNKLFSRLIAVVLIMLMSLTLVQPEVFAKDYGTLTGDKNFGNQKVSITTSTTEWNADQVGIRFYIIDKDGNQVSNVVDILKSYNRILDSSGNKAIPDSSTLTSIRQTMLYNYLEQKQWGIYLKSDLGSTLDGMQV